MNNRNYQLEMDRFLSRLESAKVRPGLLLHCCCAPCSSYVLEYLSAYFKITLYFCNPNMDSKEEYDKRAKELEVLVDRMFLDKKLSERPGIIIADYDNESFEKMAEGLENEPERGERCRKCYELRLRKTAEYLKTELSKSDSSLFDPDMNTEEDRKYKNAAERFPLVPVYFCTTLTLSPKKNAQWVNEEGEKIAAEYGLSYFPSDFKCRGGYERSYELSEKYDLYRQNYCGCRFSYR